MANMDVPMATVDVEESILTSTPIHIPIPILMMETMHMSILMTMDTAMESRDATDADAVADVAVSLQMSRKRFWLTCWITTDIMRQSC